MNFRFRFHHGTAEHLKSGIYIIIALHIDRHGIRIPGIQISRHLHIFNIRIFPHGNIIQYGQKLHLFGYQRRSRAFDISFCFLSVGKDYQAAGCILRYHRKTSGNCVLEIGCRLIHRRHHAGKILLLGNELFHQRIFTECHNSILIVFWHLCDHFL